MNIESEYESFCAPVEPRTDFARDFLKSTAMQTITTLKELHAINGRNVLCFWTSWSAPSKATLEILSQLQATHSTIGFYQIEAEECSDVSEALKVSF